MKTKIKEIPKNNYEIDNILVSCKAGVITTKDIQISINNYLDTLYKPEEIYNNKPMLFNGLLEYIYKHNIKHLLQTNDNNDYYNWEFLNDVFINIYLNLCYSFNYLPMVSTFVYHMVHINIQYIYTIKNGLYSNGEKVISNANEYIKEWLEYCDSDLFNHIAQNNSVGGMFVAKVRGYSDQPNPGTAITVNLTPNIDEKQLKSIAAMLPNTDN